MLKFLLHRLRKTLAAAMRRRWNRDLPFAELLSDRWERARELGFGEGSSIYDSSHVYGDLKVGKNTWIGPMTLLDATGGLTIGDGCNIGAGVKIYSHDTVKRCVSGGKTPKETAPVMIGDRTYIGSNAVIAKGVTVGDRCVIGACSFVNRDIPSGSIAVGQPCRVIGKVLLRDDTVELVYD